MPRRGGSWRRCSGAVLAAFLLSAGGGCEPADHNAAGGRGPAASVSPQPMRSIDAAHPSVSVPLGAMPRDDGDAFVAVEVREVVNPGRVPLTFEVAFQPEEGEAVRLGEFSLFPPDNPGRFIVATQGRLRPPGAIVVALSASDRAAAQNVRVGIGGIALTDR